MLHLVSLHKAKGYLKQKTKVGRMYGCITRTSTNPMVRCLKKKENLTMSYAIVSHNSELVHRYYEIVSHSYEILSHHYEIVSRNSEIS